jgi:hypothetical protein
MADYASSGGNATPEATTGAFTVEIGDFVMNTPSYKNYPDEDAEFYGHGLGQPNPTRISWSKNNEIATHKIPDPKWKTMRTSKETLWTLDIEFTVLEKKYMEKVQTLVDDVGPHFVKTFFKQMYMYVNSLNATADAGYSDSRWHCSMKLTEIND